MDGVKAGYKDFLRQQIVSSLVMLFLMIYLLYKIATTIVSSANWDTMAKFLAVGFVIMLLALIQFFYGFLALHELVIPYKGVVDLLFNWGAVFA